jgi:hypothetical protein
MLLGIVAMMYGEVEMEELENWNGKLKRKTKAESGNGKAENLIRKWSSTFLALRAPICACAVRLGFCQGCISLTNDSWLDLARPED